MFIKQGDGKIISVIETEELTEEQKKIAKKMANKTKEIKTVSIEEIK